MLMLGDGNKLVVGALRMSQSAWNNTKEVYLHYEQEQGYKEQIKWLLIVISTGQRYPRQKYIEVDSRRKSTPVLVPDTSTTHP